jgi:rhodanese-related sulfurtransferase
MLLDNGYSNVFDMTVGLKAWMNAGYAIETNIVYPAGLLRK